MLAWHSILYTKTYEDIIFIQSQKNLKVQRKGLSLSEANIKIILVGLITITPQAKNIKDDKVYLTIKYILLCEFSLSLEHPDNYFYS